MTVSSHVQTELLTVFLLYLVSRDMFNKYQAQRWWTENYDRIMELYNVQRLNRQAFPLPTPPRSEDEVNHELYPPQNDIKDHAALFTSWAVGSATHAKIMAYDGPFHIIKRVEFVLQSEG